MTESKLESVYRSKGGRTWENGAEKTRQTKVSCNSELYSGHQTVYTLTIKRGHLSKVISSSCVQSQGHTICGIEKDSLNI